MSKPSPREVWPKIGRGLLEAVADGHVIVLLTLVVATISFLRGQYEQCICLLLLLIFYRVYKSEPSRKAE